MGLVNVTYPELGDIIAGDMTTSSFWARLLEPERKVLKEALKESIQQDRDSKHRVKLGIDASNMMLRKVRTFNRQLFRLLDAIELQEENDA